MIIANQKGDIFGGSEKHIAFAVNTEGINDSGFAGVVSRQYWSELASIGACELGTVLSKKISEDRTVHALVCHSLKKGWINQRDIIKQCFDKIPCEGETVSSIAIGTGLVGVLSGADYSEIINGMKASTTKIVLYTV